MKRLLLTRLRRLFYVSAFLAGASCSDILGFERGHLASDGGQTAGGGGGAPDGASMGRGGGGDGSIPPRDGSVDTADARLDVAIDASRPDASVDVGNDSS